MGDSPTSPHASSSSDAHALRSGTRLAEFEIRGVLGLGGFAIVYLAYDHSLHRQVAIKEYLPGSLAHRDGTHNIVPHSQHQRETFETGLRSFIQEARLLAQFDHPALVKVYRFWEGNGTAYMAIAYYEGVTLKQAYGNTRPGQEEIVELIAPLLDAVEVLHRAKCFHRDIAPDNVIVQPGGALVLLDFGAARRIIGEMTQALTVVLKSGYAPIEQYAEDNSQAQGPWTDVYAIGAMIHWLIRGKSPPASVMRTMSDPYVPLARDVPAGFEKRFVAGVDRALAIRPEARPQSIAELRAALGLAAPKAAPAARGVAVTQKPDTEKTVLAPHPRDVQRAKERRRFIAVAGGIVAAAVVITVLAVLNVLGPPAPEPKVAAVIPSKVEPSTPPATPAPAPVVSQPVPETPPAAPAAATPPPSAAETPSKAPPPMRASPAPASTPAAKPTAPQPAVTDPKEQYELARDLQRGNGRDKDPAQAVIWLRRSAEQGYARAQVALAAAYEKGDAVTKDPADAFGWYKRAAAQGNVDAQVKVAQFYKDGIGVSKDTEEALKWYRKASEKGNAEARQWIVQLEFESKPIPTKNAPTTAAQASTSARTPAPSQAIAKAPTTGTPALLAGPGQQTAPNPPAAKEPTATPELLAGPSQSGAPKNAAQQYELGQDYRLGRKGIAINFPEAVKWYRAAADQGHAAAQNALGYSYRKGEGVALDYVEARKWLEKSAANGNADALSNLGLQHRFGEGVQRNEVLASQYQRKAAEAGSTWGMLNLAWHLENGRGVFRDPPAAVEWYRKAASAGSTEAMFLLGRMYENGTGVPASKESALTWYKVAAARGNKDAAQRVAQLDAAK